MSDDAHKALHGYLATHEDGAYVSVSTVLIARVKTEWEAQSIRLSDALKTLELRDVSLAQAREENRNAASAMVAYLGERDDAVREKRRVQCRMEEQSQEIATLASSRDHIMATYQDLCGKYTEEKEEHEAARKRIEQYEAAVGKGIGEKQRMQGELERLIDRNDTLLTDLTAYRIALRTMAEKVEETK